MECLAPMTVPDPKRQGKYIQVPCGKCEACLTNKASSWYVRLKYEFNSSRYAVHCTLTYDNDHLPLRVHDGHMVADVSRRDVQKYHYRLRKHLGERSKEVKYFLCSEYGPNPINGCLPRPHYHVIYFNLAPSDYELVKTCWNKGHVEFKEVVDNTIRYLSGYCIEKLFQAPFAEKNFAFISKGIGADYIEKFRSFHAGQLDRFYTPLDGKRYPMPRYYKERLYDEDERAVFAEVCKSRSDLVFDAQLTQVGGSIEDLFHRQYEIRSNFVRKCREKRNKKKNI